MVESEYAKAVYELAKEEKKVTEFGECFAAVTGTMTEEYMEILSSPFITKDDKKEMVAKVYHSLDGTFVNFLNVLVDHNRFSIISSIEKEYTSLVLKEKNVMRVELKSASRLTDKQLERVKATLSAKYAGKTIEIKNTVDPQVIGGVEVLSEEESLDASVKGTLSRIRESI